MPLGAFRLNTLAKFVSQVPSVGGDSLISLGDSVGDVTYPDVCYAGLDSNNLPTFVVAWRDTSNSLGNDNILMFRVNQDATITLGTVQRIDSALSDYSRLVRLDTEYNITGAGYRNEANEEPYGVVVYLENGGSWYARAFEMDQDNLTVTLGTREVVNNHGGLGQITYVGNRQYHLGYRGGNNGSYWMVSTLDRSSASTSLTFNDENSQVASIGGAAVPKTLGYPDDKHMVTYRMNNNSGLGYALIREESGSFYSAGNTDFGQSDDFNATFSLPAKLNTTNKFISVVTASGPSPGYTSLRAVDVTWESGTTAPTSTFGDLLKIQDGANGELVAVPDPVVDDQGILFDASTDTVRYQSYSVSGTTISIDGTWSDTGVSFAAGTYPWYTSAESNGLKYYVVVFRDTGNNLQAFTLVNGTLEEPVTPPTRPLTVDLYNISETANASWPGGYYFDIFANGAGYISDPDYLLEVGAGDFTFEWIMSPAGNDFTMFDYFYGTDNADRFRIDVNANWQIEVIEIVGGVETVILTATNNVAVLDAYDHFAVTREDGVVKIWVDGVFSGSAAFTTDLPSAGCAVASEASYATHAYDGAFGEVRISRVARYTSAFTPPSGALSDDIDTLVLFHSDGDGVTNDDYTGPY